MNRDIKFRCWSPDNKEMYYPDENYCFRLYNTSIGFYPHGHSDDLHHFSTNPSSEELKIEVMQFTGLLDKNGKEIYEGDEVEYQWNDSWTGEWVSKSGVVEYKNGEYFPVPNNDSITEFEIIGNIYEQPTDVTN